MAYYAAAWVNKFRWLRAAEEYIRELLALPRQYLLRLTASTPRQISSPDITVRRRFFASTCARAAKSPKWQMRQRPSTRSYFILPPLLPQLVASATRMHYQCARRRGPTLNSAQRAKRRRETEFRDRKTDISYRARDIRLCDAPTVPARRRALT